MSKKELLEKRKGRLSPAQMALFQKRIKGDAGSERPDRLTRRSVHSPVPLSFSQQRLWFLSQLEPDTSAYNIPNAVRLSGRLNVAALTRCLDEIVRRHESLRTRFTTIDGQPVQVIGEPQPAALTILDLSDLNAADRETRMAALANTDAGTPFDLEQGPLLRASLLVLGKDEHVLLFTMHHIVSDAWSMTIFIREIVLLYQAFAAGRPSPLAELAFQYPDFADWQRRHLDGTRLESQLSFWKERLADCPPLELITDYPRPAVQTFHGDAQSFMLDLGIADGLRALSRETESTLFMTLLAVFQVLLARYTGQTDVVVGTAIANRNRDEIESIIGFFVNTMALRADLSGDPPFRDFLRQVRATTLAAYANQDLPFEKLVDEVHPQRDLSRSPIFQVMFTLQNTPPVQSLDLPGLTLSQVSQDDKTTKFDLVLSLIELPDGGLSGSFGYNTDLFEGATIARMIEHFRNLTAAIVSNPRRTISGFEIMSDIERVRLLPTRAPAETEVSLRQPVFLDFEAHAAASRDAPAVWAGEGAAVTYSYGQLNTAANRLARVLRGHGIGPESVVAVYTGHSPAMVLAVLAVHKAGAAYLPLDPANPAPRNKFTIEDGGAALVLTTSELALQLPATPARVVALDDEALGRELEAQGTDNPGYPVAGDQTAYVIYTSGSTGKPKGVAVTHKALANLTAWHRRAFEITSADRASLIARVAFDASVWELWPYLAAGASVVPAGRHLLSEPENLRDWLAAKGISVCFLPTPLAELMLALEWPATGAPRLLLTGGDLLRRRPPEHAPFRLINNYGPSENAVVATSGLVSSNGDPRRPPAIGKAIDGCRIYTLDRGLRLVPTGVAGELCIAGSSLARGYLHRPDLTAATFVPNPYAQMPGERIYKTGDLVRCLPGRAGEGLDIEFRGRIDHQVKVRGFRIELGEIEVVLAAHPAVAENLVIVGREGSQTGSADENRLIAYVVIQPGRAQNQASLVDEMREYLKRNLPGYMVPSAFVIMDALPRTATGKPDRRALPLPQTGAAKGRDYAAPRTPAEQTLAEIWSALLGREQVGIADNFFELGGDSILSIQIVARARQAGLALTTKQIFEHQTIAELAPRLGKVVVLTAEQGVVTGTAPLTPIQRWFLDANQPEPHHFNQSFLLEMACEAETDHLAAAVAALLTHHDVLRARFIADESGRQIDFGGLGGALSSPESTFLFRDLTELELEEQTRTIEREAATIQASLDLAHGPLMRVVLFRSSAGSRLLLVVHHLVVDGVSWRILLEDLATIYGQLSAGLPVQLPLKTTSFKRWSLRLAEHGISMEIRAQAAYWSEVTKRIAASAPLPIDRPDGANLAGTTAATGFVLDAEATRALLREVPKAYNTQINDILLTALTIAWSEWTHATAGEPFSLAIDIEGHGREELFADLDLSRTLGWFTTVYPVVLSLPPEESAGARIKALKEQLRAVPNRGIGYGMLRFPAQAATELEASAKPLVSFNYLGQTGQTLEGDSLFGPAPESAGPSMSPATRRDHLLEVTGITGGEQLSINIVYSQAIHERSTIEPLAEAFERALLALIAHCIGPDAGGRTPSDFPLAEIDPDRLDQLMARHPGIVDLYPLSPMQGGLIFHSIYEPDAPVYFEQLGFRLGRQLDPARFNKAWRRVLARHPSLRTSFHWENLKEPLQAVHAEVDLPWQELDWRHIAADQLPETLQRFMAEDRGRGFDPSVAPLMRLVICRLQDGDFQLLWSYHHLLLDGWSLPILFGEVFAAYEADLQNQAFAPPRAMAFRDYIAWLAQTDKAAAESFWREELTGFPAATVLPRDLARPGTPDNHTNPEIFEDALVLLPEAVTIALSEAARQHRVTMSTIVQAAWSLILAHHGGGADVLFGLTVSGRPPELAGAETAIGLFINTLPVRVRIPRDRVLWEWLRELQSRQVAREAWAYSPLASVQGWSGVARGKPLFESIMVFENYPVDASLAGQGGGLGVAGMVGYERTNYAISLTAAPGAQLSIRLAYDAQRFGAETMNHIARRMTRLLSAMADSPNTKPLDLPVIDAEERALLLGAWSGTRFPVRTFEPLHRMVENHAQTTPERVAVIFGGRQGAPVSLTYEQLNTASDALARRLIDAGCGPETPVAVFMDRSAELPIAFLAILKAGAAYLPLDPAYPAERLAFLIEDARPGAFFIGPGGASPPAPREIPVLIVGGDVAAAYEPRAGLRLPICDPLSTAYIIYTSGSTGRPKGVTLTHGGLANLAAAQIELFQTSGESRILQFAPLSFDASIWEMAMAFGAGARLCLEERDKLLPGGGLESTLTTAEISHITLPPSTLTNLSDGPYPALAKVVVAGEACPADLVHRFAPGRRFFNAYGPTETTVCASASWCRVGEPKPGIGTAIDHTRTFILDPKLELVPAGVVGELCVGGLGLARGYLARPARTAQSFVPNPFAQAGEPGTRLYRTGDAARFLASGEIEFLGRIDDQVKIRGFRIEPGEIEAALQHHPVVREAAVIARELGPGDIRLLAFLLTAPDCTLTSGDWRAWLSERLPAQFIPHGFTVIDSFPRSPSGKVDRAALAQITLEERDAHSTYHPPRNEVERSLARIWAEVLRRERIGIEDNFFESGGDSILSIQIIARAKQAGLILTPKQIFEQQTIAKLAPLIAKGVAVRAEQGPVSGSLPMTPIQHWFFDQDQPDPHHFNQSFMFKAPADLDPPALGEAVRALVRHHDALRLRFIFTEFGWHQVNAAPDKYVPFEVVDLDRLPADRRTAALEAHARASQAGFQLDRGMLLRVVLYRIGGEHRLLIVAHHLAVDAVSWQFLLADLQTGYEQARTGQPIVLPAKTTSFKEWSTRLTQHAAAIAARESAYWTAPARAEVPPLPTDFDPATADDTKENEGRTGIGAAAIDLDEAATRFLLERANQVYYTRPEELLLTALARCLQRFSGHRKFLVDLESHGREALFDDLDLSRTVGWFTALYPVLLNLDGNSGPGTAIKAIKEQFRSIPAKGTGLGILRRLSRDESLRQTLESMPAAQILFNYLGRLDRVLDEASLFTPAPESAGPDFSPRRRHSHPLVINTFVIGDRLHLSWTFRRDLYRAETIEHLATSFVAELRALLAHCQSSEAGGRTPSDFPLAVIDQARLDTIAGKGSDLEDLFPLAPLQQGMLFHALYQPDSQAYLKQLAFAIRGGFDLAAFQRAWRALYARQPACRTAFWWDGLDRPLQAVYRTAPLNWEELDRTDLTEDQHQSWLENFLAEDRARGFDLNRAPLMRLILVRFGGEHHHFIWSSHHLLMDGWSMPIFMAEVFALYEAFSNGRTPNMAPPPRFRDYIAWLAGQDLARGESYWREGLGDFHTPTPLPGDQPIRSQAETERYGQVQVHLDETASARLDALSRAEHLTLNTMVQGAWALLLSRHSATRDIVFGATVSGRPPELAGVEQMIGLFINTLPVRVKVDEAAPLLPWLAGLQADQIERESFAHTPLIEIQGWSGVARGANLFESIVVFENYPIDEALPEQQGLNFGQVADFDQNNFPLTIAVIPGPQMTILLSYDANRLSQTGTQRLGEHLIRLLSQIAANPAARLRDLDHQDAAERTLLLETWSGAARFRRVETGAVHQFQAWAARQPKAPAVLFADRDEIGADGGDPGRRLDFATLNARANQVAHYLQTLGLAPETPVAVCLDRSTEMIVAVLGALKAGAAYLPLDPAYPVERLSFMLADSGAPFVLTNQAAAGSLPATDAHLIYLDWDASPDDWSASSWEQIGLEPETDLDTAPDLDQLAYIIYTSGSTGRPKGVLSTHAGLANLIREQIRIFAVEPASRVLQFASISFDASVSEVFVTLCAGASLVMAQRARILPGPDLAELLASEHISHVTLPPSALAYLPHGDFPDLTTLVSAGEAVNSDLIARFAPGRRFINAYGPSEAAVCASADTCGADEARPTIGRPLAHVRVYIVDPDLRPCSPGIAGELLVAGAGLARGYLNRPGLTAERFLPDPFSQARGGRLYRSGDRARFLEDGRIDFLGRIDHQIKLRGYRIELGEIEAVLEEVPEIAEAAVVLRDHATENPRLVAYVRTAAPLTDGERDNLTGRLRTHLMAKLPEFMCPSAFVAMDSFPLSAAGKLDRKALPDPATPLTDASSAAPVTPAQEVLAAIWREVLGREQIGIHENFFDLGGHSLLATQVISRAGDAFGAILPVHHLFEAPTIAAFALRLEAARRGGAAAEEPPILPVARESHMALSFAQQRLWFLSRLENAGAAYHMLAFQRIRGKLDRRALSRAMNAVLARHEALRTNFIEHEGLPIQIISAPEPIGLNLIDLTGLKSETRDVEAQWLSAEEAQRSFDLAHDRLIRAALVRLAPDQHLLLATMHHIVSDGWSIGVLTREVSALYTAFVTGVDSPGVDSPGVDSPLAPLSVQYADFATWQRNWLSGPVLEAQLAFWQEQLAGAPALIDLPLDRPRPPLQTFNGDSLAFHVEPELSAALADLGRQRGATPFMTLHAAFALLLSRYSGQQDIVLGSPIANRNRQEIEPLIGFFVNTLVLRTRLTPAKNGRPLTFLELLDRVRRTDLDAYAHQDLPFELIVERMRPERDLSHAPIFQVFFAMQNAPLAAQSLPGLEIEPVGGETKTAKFELSLYFNEIGPGQGLHGAFEFNTDLFENATIARMAGHFVNLLRALCADPSARLDDLALSDGAEYERVLAAGRGIAGELPPFTGIYQGFRERVEASPDAIALISGAAEDRGRSVTYAQLDTWVTAIAAGLEAAGLDPAIPVGVCLARSPETAAVLLAILRLGGFYLPLDPSYPAERLAFLVADSGARLIIGSETAQQLFGTGSARVLRLDALLGRDPAQVPPIRPVWADTPACLIYTSGSTGQPKGVIAPHGGALNRAAWMWREFPFTPGELCGQRTSLNFVDSIWECFGPLLAGVPSLILPSELVQDTASLIDTLAEFRVTRFVVVPSLLRVLFEQYPDLNTRLPDLRLWTTSGEAIEPDLVRRFHEVLNRNDEPQPRRILLNLYGSSEVAADTSYHVADIASAALPAVPIGRAIDGTAVYLLDRAMNPVPAGLPGEIYVSGAGLASGYLHQPSLTAERFLPNPFATSASPARGASRLYRTGDRARFLPAVGDGIGPLQYLGRGDRQYKIRGFRVELGEIEAALTDHPLVAEAVVTVYGEHESDRRLAAYIVPALAEIERTASAAEAGADGGGSAIQSPALVLAAYLRQKLPAYMVPATYLLLESLPLTPNGKLDRRALPRPETGLVQKEFIAPSSDTECRIAAVWREVLAIERVGLNDNFFELGGHSLLATQVTSRLARAFQVEIPLKKLFETQNLLGLAEHIDLLLTARQLQTHVVDHDEDREEIEL